MRYRFLVWLLKLAKSQAKKGWGTNWRAILADARGDAGWFKKEAK